MFCRSSPEQNTKSGQKKKKKKDKRLLKAIKNEDYVNKLICKSHKHPKMSYICDQIMTEIIVAKMKFKEIKMYAKHKVYNTSKL